MKKFTLIALVLSLFCLVAFEDNQERKDEEYNYEKYKTTSLLKYSSQTEEETKQNQIITVESDTFILPNPDGAYKVDFSKVDSAQVKIEIDKQLAVGVEQRILLAAYIFPPPEPYWVKNCSRVPAGRYIGKRCSDTLMQKGIAKACYIADVSLYSNLLHKMFEPLVKSKPQKEKEIRKDIGDAFIRQQKENIHQTASHVFAEGEDYIVYKVSSGSLAMEGVASLVNAKLILNGRVFSTWCKDKTLDYLYSPASIEKWESETMVKWIEKIIQANKESSE
ncbi:hypothetical protein [Pelistega ratti]|uniref:hypothetical protein n=1 Tax=Pelistega ratti TaxID=2652177 RepID=UPI00135BB810|nr:hypothetical protein [Pelistega ratti]